MAEAKRKAFEAVYREKMTGDRSGVDALIREHQQQGQASREEKRRAAAEKAIADVGVVPVVPRYERQINLPEIAADNTVPYLREVTLAQKAYDDYVNSQEFQQRKREAATKLTRNTPMSEVPRNAQQMTESFEDDTSKTLKAKADYYKKLSGEEKNRRVMAQDMAEINAMPEEDRKLFEQYVESQNTRRSVFVNSNPILWFQKYNKETDAEKPLLEKYGEEQLKRWKETYNWYNSQQMVEKTAQDVHNTNDTAVGAVAQNLAGLPARALGGVEALAGRMYELGERTGRYTTLAPYTPQDALSVYGNAVTADTSARIAGDGDSKLRKGLSVGYQAVTSAADSGARLLFGGSGGALALAGINSFTSTLNEASQKGATPEQAYLMATASAGLEVLTEKVSLDKALEKAKQLGGSDLRKWILNTIGQGVVEISEEEASYIGGLIAEAAILQGKSEYNQTIGELVANGMSYEEAKAQANKDVWNEAVNTAVVSGLSGSIMGAGATAYSDVMTKLGNRQGAQASPQEATGSPQAAALPETSTDTTNAQSPDVDAAGTPQAGNALTNALDKLAETGNVSNKTVEKILSDPAAMEQLSRQTGLDLSQLATASEKRNAVKAAIRQIAGDAAPTTLNREGAQSLIEDMGQELAERAPARQETPEVSPKRQAVQNAIDQVLGVDTGTNGNYNQINENPIQGGIENAGTAEQGAAQGAGNQLYGASGEGVQPVQGSESGNPGLQGGRDLGQGDIRDSGELLLSDTAQKALSEKGSPQVTDSSGQSTEGGQSSTLGAQNAPSGDINQSKTFTNTGLHSADADIRAGYEATVAQNPDAANYDIKHNADTLATAKDRTGTPEKVQAEYNYLMGKEAWTAEDLVTAKLVTKSLFQNGGDGAQSQITEMNQRIQEHGTNLGQTLQAFSIIGTMEDAKDPMTAAQHAQKTIMNMKQEDSTFRQKEGGPTFKQWQKGIADSINRIAMAVEQVQDGDSAGMRDIIRQIARDRNTTAWFGTSQNLTKAAESVLGKLDFDDLKTVANAQIAAMSDDFRARSKKDIAMGIRKQNMLSSIASFARNITGNSGAGLLDSASESFGGRLMDTFLSRYTGRKEMGNDFKHAKDYYRGAKDAANFASLCVELNIPVETDSASSLSAAIGGESGGKYVGKTFRPTGNIAMRAMYAYQKYMSYALDVTDKIFEGGTNRAVSESLNNLKNANLTDDQIAKLAEFAANRRTFKDATWEDWVGDEKRTHGSNLSRAAVGLKKGAGVLFGKPGEIMADTALPFASVPMNVAQTGIDYSAGIAKGIGEAVSIIKDAKAGKEIAVARQRQAASDFGRGLTGVGLVSLFTAAAAAGVMKVNDPKDKDEKALLQAEGRSGAQINWSALSRGLTGGSAEWQDGDVISTVDFLEPFNTHMYLGYELSQEDSVLDMIKAYPGATVKAVFNSLMDSPMMTGLSDIQELIDDVQSAETDGDRLDAFAGYAGDAVGSFIPQFVRQTAQLTDGYYRDTRGSSSAEYAINNIIAGLPGLSQTLPKKYSGLGEAQKRGGFMSIFADPSRTRVYHENEVTGYLEDLSQSLNGDTSFIPDRQAPMKLRVNGEDIKLDGAARERYQKTYGELVNSYYSRLMGSSVFQGLSDEQKANALNRAKTYATEHARAAVSDYTTDKPRDAAQVTSGIIQDLMRSEFSKAFDSMEPEALDKAYGLYQSLPFSQRENFKRNNGGRTGYYITAKEAGVSDGTFTDLYGTYKELGDNSSMTNNQRAQEWARTLGNAYESGRITKTAHDALKDAMKFRQTFAVNTEKFDAMTESGLTSDTADQIIKGLAELKGTGSVDEDTGEATVTNRDKWGYIAALDGLSDAERDSVMKLYMPDYNPKAKSPNKTELKYDYLRDNGYSAEQFTEVYGVTQEYSKKADMIAAWEAMGYSKDDAQMLYKLFKGKIDVTGYAGSGGTEYPTLKEIGLIG